MIDNIDELNTIKGCIMYSVMNNMVSDLNKSTSLAIFNFSRTVISEINNRKIVGTLYLGFSKAFDSINHWRLKEKLQDMGVPNKLLNWIVIYLRIDYGDGRVIRGSSTKMVISQLWNVIFRHAIHH